MKRLCNRHGPVLVLAALLLVQPPWVAPSAAQDAPIEEAAGAGAAKFLDYALCAVSIVAASTGVGAVVAVLTCAKAVVTWWSE